MDVKERVDTLNVFSPIRLVNGFIALDFVWGCYRCSFCFNRDQFQFYPPSPCSYPLSPVKALSMLEKLPSYQAGTLIKIGHNSDQSLQMKPAWDFYRLIPYKTMLVFYRRKPISREERQLLATAAGNLLLVVTLTPESRLLNISSHEAWELLESTAGLGNCFYEIRPVAQDAIAEAYQFIEHLPAGSIIDICGVIGSSGGESIRFDPDLSPANAVIQKLKDYAVSLGLRVNCAVNCILRGRQGQGTHWAEKNFSSADKAVIDFCQNCASFEVCREGIANEKLDDLLTLAKAKTGITDLQIQTIQKRSLILTTRIEINRGDQTYLRNLFNCRIKFEGRENELTDALTEAIYHRWQETKFFPVADLHEIAAEMRERMNGNFA